jgi:hypothetical protein
MMDLLLILATITLGCICLYYIGLNRLDVLALKDRVEQLEKRKG